MKGSALTLALLLVACHSGQSASSSRATASTTPDLENAAIEAGVIHDPSDTEITGLYARDTDRVCVVPSGQAYRIGAFVDYGENQGCSAHGTATRVGETVHVEFQGKESCSFEATFDGTRITFPGRLPDGCQSYCERRASFAALDPERLSDSVSEASSMRDGKGALLCGG